MTLHKFAVKYIHDKSRHVLDFAEEAILEQVSKGTGIDFVRIFATSFPPPPSTR